MSLKAPNTPVGGNRVPQEAVEPGVYPARLVRVVDAGLQPQQPYEGQPKPPAHTIFLTYELLDVFMLDEDGNEQEDRPRWVSEQFALRSMQSDLAISTKRINVFDPTGELEGDFARFLGTPVMVTITNYTNKKGETKEKVSNVAAMRSKDVAKAPELQNEAVIFTLADPDIELYNSLPQWQREMIASNLNFKGSPLEALLGDAPPPKKAADKPAAQKQEEPQEQGGEEEDVPW